MGESQRYDSAEEHWSEFRRSLEGTIKLAPKDKNAGLEHPSFKLNYHLNRLEDLGELKYRQFVFPKLSRDSFSSGLLKESKLKDLGIVWALSSHRIDSLGAGLPDDPVCLDFWYLPKSEERVVRYVEDLYRQVKTR